MKYLIVEDDSIDAQVLSRRLRNIDFVSEIVICLSAQDCISRLKEQSFDCIFIDYFLPDMNGEELFEKIQQMEISAPVIIVTGQGDESLAVNLMKKGVKDYIPKNRISKINFKEVLEQILLAKDNQKCLEENEKLNKIIASKIKEYN
jgi:DNA-binding NtrC family response regulator